MPLVNIQLLEGRPENKIRELIKNVTDTVSETVECPKERVRVVVEEIPKTHLGKGGVLASEENDK